MKTLVLVLSFVLACIFGKAQTSSLTITSEGGHPFFLFLNGKLVNTRAESGIRVEKLAERTYAFKLVFENNGYSDIKRAALSLVDAAHPYLAQDVVYKVSGTRPSKQKLVFISSKAADSILVMNSYGVISYEFGTAIPSANPLSGNEPAKTANNNLSTAKEIKSAGRAEVPDTQCVHAMGNPEFQAAKAAINTTVHDEPKLKGAKAIALGNCLTAKQITEICMIFDFEVTKLSFARFAYSHCFDKKNYAKVLNLLRNDPDRAALSFLMMKDYPIPVTIIK